MGYGTTTSFGSSSAFDDSLVTSHTAELTGLALGTTYYYVVKSEVAAGNESRAGAFTFYLCNISGPTVFNVAASEITQTSVKITWTTDVASTSQVEYGLTSSLGMTTSLHTDLVTSHSTTLSGLVAGSYHYYNVKSRDNCENEGLSLSSDNFTTPA